jgi:predicted transcriptional regulator
MGVISVRLNKDEEKILKKLSDYYHANKSTLVKKSLFELYENMVDLDIVKKFEAKEKKGKVSFFTAEDILNEI